MIKPVNRPVIRHQIQILEELRAQLTLQMACEVKKMEDMVVFCQANPFNQKYRQRYHHLQQHYDEYQRQYEFLFRQITELRKLLQFAHSKD